MVNFLKCFCCFGCFSCFGRRRRGRSLHRDQIAQDQLNFGRPLNFYHDLPGYQAESRRRSAEPARNRTGPLLRPESPVRYQYICKVCDSIGRDMHGRECAPGHCKYDYQLQRSCSEQPINRTRMSSVQPYYLMSFHSDSSNQQGPLQQTGSYREAVVSGFPYVEPPPYPVPPPIRGRSHFKTSPELENVYKEKERKAREELARNFVRQEPPRDTSTPRTSRRSHSAMATMAQAGSQVAAISRSRSLHRNREDTEETRRPGPTPPPKTSTLSRQSYSLGRGVSTAAYRDDTPRSQTLSRPSQLMPGTTLLDPPSYECQSLTRASQSLSTFGSTGVTRHAQQESTGGSDTLQAWRPTPPERTSLLSSSSTNLHSTTESSLPCTPEARSESVVRWRESPQSASTGYPTSTLSTQSPFSVSTPQTQNEMRDKEPDYVEMSNGKAEDKEADYVEMKRRSPPVFNPPPPPPFAPPAPPPSAASSSPGTSADSVSPDRPLVTELPRTSLMTYVGDRANGRPRAHEMRRRRMEATLPALEEENEEKKKE